MAGDLAELVTTCAAAGVCVKVGTWCSALIRHPGQQMRLESETATYHAEITVLASPTQWGPTYQGWGDDPAGALRMAMERWQIDVNR